MIAFHNAAIAAGARSLAEPGLRPEYSDEYYAARIADFDGNVIETVCREVVASTPARAAA